MRSLKDLLKIKQTRKNTKKIDEKVDEKCIEKIFLEMSSDVIGIVGQGDFQRIAIKDRVLYLKTFSSSIASEIWRNKEKIIEKINKETGGETISKIKIN
jgi:hypothetical protein